MVEIVKAQTSDMMSIGQMADIAFRHTYRDILSPQQIDYMMDMMYSPSNLKRQFDEGHAYYIAYCDAAPAGYVSVQADGHAEDGRPRYHLHKIYVLPPFQGRGIGRMLFDRILEHVRKEVSGVPFRLELNVNRNNSATRFYRRLGLEILRQGDFHIGNGYYMNDYIMGAVIE